MMKNGLTVFLLFFATQYVVAKNYLTQTFSSDIHSIEVLANGQWNSYPVIGLNSADQIHIDFDELSDDLSNLRYKLIYCNSDWTENKTLSEIDYLDGYNDNLIDDYATSYTTNVSYVHYSLKIPNEEVRPKLSGNYAVVIYDEDRGEDEILLTACFSVLDQKLAIAPKVSTITDIDANDKHHQVSFDLKYNFAIRDVQNDLKVSVRQNNRIDSERINIKPTYIQPSVLRYEHNKNLIFEGGNEYYRFDISSYRTNGMNVRHIQYVRPNYHIYITPNQVRGNPSYSYDQDQNGRVIYRVLDSENVNIEGDYVYTHFTLQAERPLPNDVYLNGAFTNNLFSEKYKMQYNEEDQEYNLTLLLKQGIYNYQFLTNNGNGFSTSPIDGSFYETENEYSIYVYYRPQGQRYDSLIGFVQFQSREK